MGKSTTDLTELTSLASGDLVKVVDVSESSPSSKDKKLTLETLTNYLNTNLSITGVSSPVVAVLDSDFDSSYSSNVLTASSNGAFSPDGVTVAADERVLLIGQDAETENGIYTVTTVGDGSTAAVLTRAADMNTTNGVNSFLLIQSTGGTEYANTFWGLGNSRGSLVLDTTSLYFNMVEAPYLEKTKYGQIQVFEDDGAFDSGDYTVTSTGGTITVNASDITVDTSTYTDYTNYVSRDHYTGVDLWTQEVEGTLDAYGASVNIGIGGTGQKVGVILVLNNGANHGKMAFQKYSSSDTPTAVSSVSPDAISITEGQDYKLTLKRVGNTFYYTAQNITTSGDIIRGSITYEYTSTDTVSYAFGKPRLVFNDIETTINKWSFTIDESERKKFCFLGDSIITGAHCGTYGEKGAYHILRDLFSNDTTVVANGGNDMDELSNLTDEVELLKPKYVIISSGFNDANASVTANDYETDLDTILTSMDSAGIIPIILTPAPCVEASYAYNSLINEYRDKIFTKTTRHIIDINTVLKDSLDELESDFADADGIHINEQGHAVMAKYIYNYIRQLY